MVRRITRVALIIVPLLTCAARVQSRTLENPEAIVKELARCFSIVKIGATRRHHTPSVAIVWSDKLFGDRPPNGITKFVA